MVLRWTADQLTRCKQAIQVSPSIRCQHSTNSLAELYVIALDREDYLIFIHAYARHSSVIVSIMPPSTTVYHVVTAQYHQSPSSACRYHRPLMLYSRSISYWWQWTQTLRRTLTIWVLENESPDRRYVARKLWWGNSPCAFSASTRPWSEWSKDKKNESVWWLWFKEKALRKQVSPSSELNASMPLRRQVAS